MEKTGRNIIMYYNLIVDEFKKHGNMQKAVDMAAYMRNKFGFYGIQTPNRRKITTPIFKEMIKSKSVDWDFIDHCWRDSHRELQYTAIGYLSRLQKYLTLEDITKIKNLAISKPWWDTVDSLAGIIGNIVYRYKAAKMIMLKWSVDECIWLRRIAIIHQLQYKEKTDKELMEKIICNNLGSNEFFIDKAIGWCLRDYSKTNSAWVASFLEKYRSYLSKLSIREGSKYI